MTLLEGRLGGSTVYALSLIAALEKRDDVDVRVISSERSGGLATARWMLSGADARVRAIGADVLHCPGFLAPLRSSVPRVQTIHDLSLGRMPSGHPLEWRMYYRYGVPRAARSAAVILTATEVTKRDVVNTFRVPAERIVVQPYGVDERFFAMPQRDRSATPSEPSIVFPGPPIGRKNLDMVLRVLAAAHANSALSRAMLQITGATAAEFPEYSRRLADLGLRERVKWLGRLAYEEIPHIYQRADVLVYPSFLEGFGFPPLEAMAVGTPVVASNASCLPEVLGDGALLIDPRDDARFAAAVESVLASPEERQRIITAGAARARTFTWARCAETTAAAYRRAAGVGETAPQAR
jgi:glycosyltransferase involved in cell wall biosynthesis